MAAALLSALSRPGTAFLQPAARLRLAPALGASPHTRLRVQTRVRVADAPAARLAMVAASEGLDVKKITGPEWKNDDEYSALDAPALLADLASVEKLTGELEVLAQEIDMQNLSVLNPDVLVQMTRKSTDAMVMLMNVATFASCASSVDGSNLEARALQAKVRSMSSKLTQASQPASLAVKLAPEDKITAFLEQCPEESFAVSHQRKLKDLTLSLAEEKLMTALSVDGNGAWSQLYNSISSTMTCDVGDQKMGVAAAAAMLASPDGAKRKAAWDGIQKAWTTHEEAAASILNAISGWRLEVNRRRAHVAGRDVHYLDTALHQNRMTRKSLDAMMLAVDEGRPVAHRALQLQARLLGKQQLHPSDLMAPPPVPASTGSTAVDRRLEFPEAVSLIRDAVSCVDPSVGDFVKMMSDKQWVEGREGDKKAPGAYCTGFAKSRNPRVYLSAYTGSFQHVSTLAHELGGLLRASRPMCCPSCINTLLRCIDGCAVCVCMMNRGWQKVSVGMCTQGMRFIPG